MAGELQFSAQEVEKSSRSTLTILSNSRQLNSLYCNLVRAIRSQKFSKHNKEKIKFYFPRNKTYHNVHTRTSDMNFTSPERSNNTKAHNTGGFP